MEQQEIQNQRYVPSVIFVCTANICRSPIAEALFKAILAQARQENPDLGNEWLISSAGTWAREGDPAAIRSQKVMQERGLDLHNHLSRSVSMELLRPFNLILVMERGHKEALKAEFPEIAGRVFLISEMAGYQRDVRDPYMGTLADYQDTARELENLLRTGFERINQLARGSSQTSNPGEDDCQCEE